MAVLEKIFSDEALPESWQTMRAPAYSRAYLRAAAQAFREEDVKSARHYLLEAVRLDPDLAADEGAELAAHMAAWTDLPKISNPVSYLERVYNNLPGELAALKRRRRTELARLAIRQAFVAYHDGELACARNAVQRAIRYRPHWLTNRGVLSILVRSHLPWLVKSGANTNEFERARIG